MQAELTRRADAHLHFGSVVPGRVTIGRHQTPPCPGKKHRNSRAWSIWRTVEPSVSALERERQSWLRAGPCRASY